MLKVRAGVFCKHAGCRAVTYAGGVYIESWERWCYIMFVGSYVCVAASGQDCFIIFGYHVLQQ